MKSVTGNNRITKDKMIEILQVELDLRVKRYSELKEEKDRLKSELEKHIAQLKSNLNIAKEELESISKNLYCDRCQNNVSTTIKPD